MRVESLSSGVFAFPPDVDLDDAHAIRRIHVRTQLDAGLDFVAEGQAGWNELLAHPLAVHDATRLGAAEPYPYADTSYRPPVVTGGLGFDGALAGELDAAGSILTDAGADPGERLQATLPGPYTLAALARDDHYGDERALLAAVGGFLAGEAAALPPVGAVVLLEPALVARPPGDGMDERASAAVDAVADAADAPVVVSCPGGALAPTVHAHLLDADVAAVGYDFTADHDACLSLVAEFGTKDDVALGVVDARDAEVESADTVAERLEWVRDSLPPAMDFDAAYAAPSDALHRLPWPATEGKLRALADGVAAWRNDE
jgi:5-methyltetrahydropteroyltriglutamate--homocysteine methyltransferase